jgi:pimeloyl-ACP methyl ester carboxylesterase
VAEPRFEASGDGEPVLFVPGFPFGVQAFRRLIPLAAARFRVVVPDVTEPIGSEARAAGLRDLLEELGLERCAVIAHGTGGRVAQALAFDGGDLVDALVLLASPGPTGAIAFPTSPEDALERSHVEPLGAEDADAYLEGWRREPRAYARGRAVLEAGGDDVAGLEDAMAAWERPVLILHGDEDRIVEAGIAERLSAAIPASTLGFVPESGHLLLDDAFDSIGTMILEYLRARYLRAPHDHGGITHLQLERRPSWVDPRGGAADDDGEPAVPDPTQQEVGPNP